ncbi:protein TASOR 2 isoform X7 [Papio anubis]|uniref:protein TASOR 2 isoform X7 n=1 Tax=Papio anubis TaxID=9555 RepID=UPI00083E9C70|nr:protein TASOR 2 isoform X7 [Papio anubis]
MTLGSARGAGVTLVDFQKALRAPRPTRSARPAPSSPPWRTGLGWREGAGGAAGRAETQPPPPHTMSIYDINREQDCVKNSEGILGENELRPPSQLHSLSEKIETGSLSEKIFETVSLSSDSVFQRAVSLLHTSYLDSSSEHGFQYSQVTLVKNDIFLNEYKTFYRQKKASNYTQEELQDTYGFLLFDTEKEAKLVCQRGLRVGSSAVTTLGDPAKGVYISKYSDYLHPRPWYHGKSGYVVIFNIIKYYFYELSGNTVTERPRQICPYVIVAFRYREPKTMAPPAHKSILERSENVLMSPWKGKLIVQDRMLCDIALWSTYGAMIPTQLPQELDFKYVMKVSSLKKRLPEAAFRKQNYLERKVCFQDLCFNLYEVELSNRQGENIDKLTECIKNKQLAIIKCLEDRGFFILLTSSALLSEPDFGGKQMGLHGLHLFHSPLSTGVKDLKVEDDISMKLIPILPALNCALLETKKSLPEERIHPNTLVKHFQELYKADRSPSLTVAPQDRMKDPTFLGKLPSGFDLIPPAEKCPSESLTQLNSYFSDPSAYILEVSTALDLLAEHPQSPCVSDGICDAGFSLVMTPDPDFPGSEAEVRKETETKKDSEEMLKAKKRVVVPLSPASNLRVQPKRKASMPHVVQSKKVNLCHPFPKRTAPRADNSSDSPTTLKLVKGQFPQKRKRVKGETASKLQSEISRDGQEDGISINSVQPENTTVAHNDLPENSIVNYDSQALNMLADLALSSATSSTPVSEPRNLHCSSELPQNDVLLSKENSLRSTSDHEYHRGVKSQKGELLPNPSSDRKSNSETDLIVSQDEESLVLCSQAPAKAQSALTEEMLESSDASQSSSVSVEHSYALLLREHSKKNLQEREIPSPVFPKNGTKSPEAVTPVGKVMPFRHQPGLLLQQKPPDEPMVKPKDRQASSRVKKSSCSRIVFSCDDSVKITFKCETEYAFSLDSKYTNNPLEKTVVRALHGPWNTDLPDNVEEVKLLLHMWVALFYSNQNKVIRSSRKVVEHSNPAKYVSINSTLESCELSEIEECLGLERCSADPLLETNEISRAHAAEVSFRDPNCLLPFIKTPLTQGLELCVQNEQKKTFARKRHPDTLENQDFVCSYNNEVIGEEAKQESFDKLKTSNLALSGIGSTRTNGPSVPNEEEIVQPLDSTRVASYSGTVTQTTFTRTYDGTGSQPVICQSSVCSTLENKADVPDAAMQTKTGTLQDLIQHGSPINNECHPSLERKDDNMECAMINPEPVTLIFEKNAHVPLQTEAVNTADEPTTFNKELIKQVSPAASLRHPVSTSEKAQTQGLRDISSLVVAGQKGSKYLCASSVGRETLDKEMCSLQKEMPLPVSLPSDKAMVMEALSLVKSSSYLLPSEEVRCTQNFLSQTQSLLSLSSEGLVEPTQVEVDSSAASTALGKQCSLNCISSGCHTSGDSLELRKNDKNGPNTENMNFEEFDSVFIKQRRLAVSREVSLELSEEDSDIDLALTISPPTSPREEMPAGEIEQFEEAPFSNLELQDVAEEIGEPEEVAVTESREVNSADSASVYPTVSEEPVENKERKGDNLQPVTVILSKENCTLEIAEEINVTSDFPFDSVIEEVSPASSPEPPVPVKETRPYQAVTPCILKLHGTQCEKSNRISQRVSEDLGITEKENFFVGPTHPVGQDNFTQVQQMQVSAEMPLILTDHPGRTGRPTLPGKVTEDIVSSEHDEGLSFSGKVQCYGRELNQPASAAEYTGDFSPSEKLVKSGNPLQPIRVENRNLDLKHLVLESSAPPFSPRNVTENMSLSDTLVSTAVPSGIVKQQTSPKSSQNNLLTSDLKTDEGVYLQVKSLTTASVDGAYSTQGCMCSVVPTLCSSSDSATLTHYVRPINAEPAFQAQEIPAVRMASLLKNGETEAELHKEITGLGPAGPQSNTKSSLKGECKAIHTLQDVSTCETKELLNVGVSSLCASPYQNTADTRENLSKEPLASFVSESFDTSVCGISTEHIEIENGGEGLRAQAGSETLGRDAEVSGNSDMHYELLSGDSDLDLLGDCRNAKCDLEDSCTLRGSYTRKKEDVPTDGCESSLNFHNHQGDWGCSSQVPGMEMSLPPGHWTTRVKKEEKCVPPYVQIRDLHGILRTYANFSVTKELKDTMRTSHSLRRHPSFTANCDLPSSWTSTWQVADDLTQNTLDLEYLRFAHKLKQTIKNGDSQHSASSTNVFPKELPTQISIGAFPLTKISEASILHPAPRSRSPLLVTVVESDPRPQGQPRRGYTASNLDNSSSWRERCSHNRDLTHSQRSQTVSFHLNKLKYNSTLKESRNDISLILNEYAEFNKVMKNSNQVVFQDKELNDASGEATAQVMYLPFPGRSISFEDIIIDLCSNLHIKLRSVVKEACKSTFLFYLVETEDKSFFVRTKNLLRKGGHTEIEPQHFCQAFHREDDTLIIIIRNEDISSHLHQIPSLLKLKHFPSVIFAGVDSPGDVLDHTYQELFRAGGFVITDDKILEAVTLVQLKEIIKILEKLNGNGKWKWLLHYRENKKLKEDERVDSTAHKKNMMLKSFQSANIIELLHYHQCDSRSSTKAEILKCLLNLQIQHIEARFAVFLTDKPTIPREVFENSGILVTDVNNFIENIEKVAAPFRTSYW